MSKEKIDEGLFKTVARALVGEYKRTNKRIYPDETTVNNLILAIQSYLKKEGYRKVKKVMEIRGDNCIGYRTGKFIGIKLFPKGTKIAILD